MIKFSFIIPNYKTPYKYLKCCIESILAQNYSNYEIILVDDGSPNEYQKIYEDILFANEKINLFYQNNQGVSIARNFGIKNSTGDYLIFVDSDDWIECSLCDKLSRIIDTQKSDIIFFKSYIEFENKTLSISGDLNHIEKDELLKTIFSKKTRYNNFVGIDAPWGKCCKKSFIVEKDIFFPNKIKRNEDSIFCLSAFENAKSFSFLDFYGYHYRMRKSSTCRKFEPEIIKNEINAIEYFKNFTTKNSGFDEYLSEKIRGIVMGDFMTMYYMHINNNMTLFEMAHKADKMFKEYREIADAFLMDNIANKREKILAFFVCKNKVFLFYIIYYCLYRIKNIYKSIKKDSIRCFD